MEEPGITAKTEDNNDRIYGRCRTCQGLGVYFDSNTKEYYYLDGSTHTLESTRHHVDFMEDANVTMQSSNLELVRVADETLQMRSAPKVKQRITAAGYYYSLRDNPGNELGAFTVEEDQAADFDVTLAKKLGASARDLLAARIWEIGRPTTFEEVSESLGSTIRHDRPNKLILFCAGVLNFTDSDQVNILMSGESSGGKTYTAQEVISYFPSDSIRWIGGASPTAFFHDQGKWDDENKELRVDLRQKILVFLDQPDYRLTERLRPLASHDQRELLYKITDKNKRGALRTKNVKIIGFPTIIFCAAKLSLDEQERTRVFILSPETDQEKLQESIRLRIKRDGDREAFKDWVESHPLRRWLKARVQSIREANIQQVIVEEQDLIYDRFVKTHSRLAPRHSRDISRIMGLIKAHALLNWRHRESPRTGSIVANSEDIDAGFWLYEQVAKPNELGLAPQLYEIWDTVIKPLVEKNETGVPNRTIMAEYHRLYGRFLPDRKLRREILPALESCGLIFLEADPNDRRQKLVTLALSDSFCTSHAAHVPDTDEVKGNVGEVWGTPQPDSDSRCPPHDAHISDPTTPLDSEKR